MYILVVVGYEFGRFQGVVVVGIDGVVDKYNSRCYDGVFEHNDMNEVGHVINPLVRLNLFFLEALMVGIYWIYFYCGNVWIIYGDERLRIVHENYGKDWTFFFVSFVFFGFFGFGGGFWGGVVGLYIIRSVNRNLIN